MAKHFIKEKDGHLVELSDEEYKSRKKRNGCLSIIGLGVVLLFVAIGGGDNDSKKNENSQLSSSTKEEAKAINKSYVKQEEDMTITATTENSYEEANTITDEEEPIEQTILGDDNTETNGIITETNTEETFSAPVDEQ